MVDIKDLFYGLQTEMLSSFNTNQNITHPTTKGTTDEEVWLEWLSKYLPKRYSVDSAIIIDNEGTISEQQDLVIYDQLYTPFVFNKNGVKYIPAESVYAVFEIKPTLNKGYIKYTQGKIKSVRKLKRTSKDIRHAGGTFNAKEPHTIIGGILTFDVEWTDNLGKSFESNIVSSTDPNNKIDMGICLNYGAFEITYPEDKTEERPKIFKSTDKEALITFFVKIITALQKCGTVPAIDIEKYAESLDSI